MGYGRIAILMTRWSTFMIDVHDLDRTNYLDSMEATMTMAD